VPVCETTVCWFNKDIGSGKPRLFTVFTDLMMYLDCGVCVRECAIACSSMVRTTFEHSTNMVTYQQLCHNGCLQEEKKRVALECSTTSLTLNTIFFCSISMSMSMRPPCRIIPLEEDWCCCLQSMISFPPFSRCVLSSQDHHLHHEQQYTCLP